MTKEFTVSSLTEPLSVGTLLSSVLEVFSIGPFILSGPYALLAMAIIAAAITVAYAVYGDEISDEVREKLDSAYQYFYNYIEERKKDEKTIHIYEREFQGGLPKRIYVKEFVHKKDFKVTVGELVDVITKVPSGRLALNATVKNLKEGNWELAALKGIRFIIGATGEAVAYLAIIKPEAYGPSILNITPRSNAKGPDFIYVKSTEIPPKIPSDLTKWEAKGTTVFRVTTLIRDGYNRNLEGQPGIVSVYRMKGSNLYVAFIHGQVVKMHMQTIQMQAILSNYASTKLKIDEILSGKANYPLYGIIEDIFQAIIGFFGAEEWELCSEACSYLQRLEEYLKSNGKNVKDYVNQSHASYYELVRLLCRMLPVIRGENEISNEDLEKLKELSKAPYPVFPNDVFVVLRKHLKGKVSDDILKEIEVPKTPQSQEVQK